MDPKQARMIVLWTFVEHVCRTSAQFGHGHPKTIASKELLGAIYEFLLLSEELEMLRLRDAQAASEALRASNRTRSRTQALTPTDLRQGIQDSESMNPPALTGSLRPPRQTRGKVVSETSANVPGWRAGRPSSDIDGSSMDSDEVSDVSQPTQGKASKARQQEGGSLSGRRPGRNLEASCPPENAPEPHPPTETELLTRLHRLALLSFSPWSSSEDLCQLITLLEKIPENVRTSFQCWIAKEYRNSVLPCPSDWANSMNRVEIVSSGPAVLPTVSIEIPPWMG